MEEVGFGRPKSWGRLGGHYKGQAAQARSTAREWGQDTARGACITLGWSSGSMEGGGRCGEEPPAGTAVVWDSNSGLVPMGRAFDSVRTVEISGIGDGVQTSGDKGEKSSEK